ncbi:arginine decarboxylase [Sulfobacillus sp. hq2]|nr:arginine decarboxylase [Sulfobacillus sp. hq2]
MARIGGKTVSAEQPLIAALQRYKDERKARWHTPGHKGQAPMGLVDGASDVTEVGELTPKSHRRDPLHTSEDLMAKTFGTLRTWYSVQGATLPVMASILAACRPGDTVLVDRNAHRSVLSGLVLAGARPLWIYPALGPGAYVLPVPDKVRAQMIRRHKPKAVIVTNPTYDGLSASLKESVAACQALQIPLIVDEAHGTHFFGHRGFPLSALSQGADLVCHGTHKTEPVLTQTGLLHQNTSRVSTEQIQQAWDLLATSSPSYLLMASLDTLQGLRQTPAYHARWEALADAAHKVWDDLEKKDVLVLQKWWRDQGGMADPAKLTLIGTGDALLSHLRQYGEPEKADPFGVTLVLTPYDEWPVLEQAIRGIGGGMAGNVWPDLAQWPQAEMLLSPAEAMRQPREWVPVREACGRIAAAPVTPYPPGVPVIMPGERIDSAMISWLQSASAWCGQKTGDVQGFAPPPEGTLAKEGEQGLWVTSEVVGN